MMTEQDKIDFRAWHEARLIELKYPPKIVEELSRTRELWLIGCKRRKAHP